MPSCSYTLADVALFEELSEAVMEGLTPLEAEYLGMEVGRALWAGTMSEAFDMLSLRWASLIPLVLVTGENQNQRRRLLLMLKTIFEATALTRRSGTVSAPLGAASHGARADRAAR